MTAKLRATIAAAVSGVVLATLMIVYPQVMRPLAPQLASMMAVDAQTGDAQITNDEVVVAKLDASGLPDEVQLISRVVSVDAPEQTIADPASVTNVKYLDRLGRPETSGSDVLLPVGGKGQHTVLTEARFDKPLPVAIHVQYQLDGQVVAPTDVPGASGELSVTYTLTNTTAQEEELHYSDAAGSALTAKEPVFAPFAGTVVVTVPPDVQVTAARGAVQYTDVRGNSVVAWNVSLFPPITSYQQELVLRTHAQRAAVPAVSVRLVPITSTKDPALNFTADALDASVTGNEKLYDGLSTLDDQAVTLADGAGQLATGLDSLATGTEKLSGAGSQMATGLGSLASGADQVATGNQKMADALAQAATGARQLAAATAQLAGADSGAAQTALAQLTTAATQLTEGASQLAARFGSATDPPLPDPLPAPDSDSTCRPQPVTSSATPAGAGGSDGLPGPGLPATGSPIPGTASPTPQPAAPTAQLPSASGNPVSPSTPLPASASPLPYDDDCVTLYQGVRALVTGLAQLQSLTQVMNTEIASANVAAGNIRTSLTAVGTDSATAAAGANALLAQLCGQPMLAPAQACTALASVAAAAARAAGGSAGMAEPLTQLLTSLGKLTAYGTVLDQALSASVTAGNTLLAGMDAIAAAWQGAPGSSPGLVGGLAGLSEGLSQFATALSDSSKRLSDALNKVAGGTGELADGVSQAASGASQLADGSEQVAAGAGQAAEGAGKLASGISALAGGAEQVANGGADLAAGAAAFQQQGTAVVAESVLTASTQPALARAWLDAASARASDAMPYGAPAGATGRVAYLMEIPAGPAPAPSLWDRVREWLLG